MKHARIGLRIACCALLFFATLETLARLDDWVQYGASFFALYDITNLLVWNYDGVTGRANARYKRWALNAWGYRGPAPRTGALRIVCLGASETFGIYEDNNREYPRQLEEQLNRALGTRGIEVINLALPAMTFHQLVPTVPEIIQRYHPALVTIYPSPATYIKLNVASESASSPATEPGLPLRFRNNISGRLSRFVLVRAVNLSRRILNRLRHPFPQPFRIMEKVNFLAGSTIPPDVLVWWRRRAADQDVLARGLPLLDRLPEDRVVALRRDLENVVDFFEGRGVPVVLVTHAQRFGNRVAPGEQDLLLRWRSYYPQLKEDGFLDMERRMNQVIRDVASQRRAALVDAAQLVPPGPRYFGDFVHFTNKGASAMATLLTEKLKPLVESSLAGNNRQPGRTPEKARLAESQGIPNGIEPNQ